MINVNALPEIFRINLKRLLNMKGATQKELADYMHVSPVTVNDWLKGRKMPRMNKLDMLCAFFGVGRDAFMELKEEGYADIQLNIQNISRTPLQKPIPILGTIAAGIPIEAQQDIEGYVMPERKITADFALRVHGSSMVNANILDGDVVFIRKQSDVNDGEIAAVLIDNEATLKRVYRHNGAVELRPANDTMKSFFYTKDDFVNVIILGKCVGYMHGYE